MTATLPLPSRAHPASVLSMIYEPAKNTRTSALTRIKHLRDVTIPAVSTVTIYRQDACNRRTSRLSGRRVPVDLSGIRNANKAGNLGDRGTVSGWDFHGTDYDKSPCDRTACGKSLRTTVRACFETRWDCTLVLCETLLHCVPHAPRGF